MKKKKISKLILKISCVALLTTVLISAMIIPSFAYQTTNASPEEYYYYGANSYNVAPITSLYFNYTANHTLTSYSANVPNVTTFKTKRIWDDNGLPLTGSYTEKWGANNRGTYYVNDWDKYVRNSDYPSQMLMQPAIYIEVAKDDRIYSTLPWDTNSDGVRRGTVLDVNSYIYTASNLSGDDVAMDLRIGSFVTTTHLSKYLITIQTSHDMPNEVIYHINYDFDYVSADGTFGTVNRYFSITPSTHSVISISGTEYDTYSLRLLEACLDDAEENALTQGLDREVNQIIHWKSVQITTESVGSRCVQSAVSSLMMRPYDEIAIDANNNGSNTYKGGFYTTVASTGNNLWNYVIQGNKKPSDVGNLPDMGPLGVSIGNAVNGVLEAEIFPNVHLWNILLIPFALGLVFAFIKFFAGG